MRILCKGNLMPIKCAMSDKGTLYLIPVPISDGHLETITSHVVDHIHRLRFFAAENARTARRFISSTKPPYALQDVEVISFGKHDTISPGEVLRPLSAGHDMGFMSESGCPGVADPGADLVKWAHEQGFKVKPLTGPSSIMLSLMASGMNGQTFSFHGYLPRSKGDLAKKLKDLESKSRRSGAAQIFIEAPHRNMQVVEIMLQSLNPATRVSVASDITGEDEYIKTLRIQEWKGQNPDLHKKPTVFILQA